MLSSASLLALASFAILFALQFIWPRRDLLGSGSKRMVHNFILFVINFLVMRFIVPLGLLGVSAWAGSQHLGLFNILDQSEWLAVIVCVVALDFAVYWQHVATHKFACLWRLHKVHHADHNFDVSTAIRFHPFELILSLAYKSLLVFLLGVPVLAVIIFETLLLVGPAFNHSNLKIPERLDAKLRQLVVTPDVHRVHHSVYVDEQNSNYGFFLICWDRWFATFTEQPLDGHNDMRIGLADASQSCESVDQMLMAPFH